MSKRSPIHNDTEVRLAAFDWLKSRQIEYGDVLPRKMLETGFSHDGDRVPLLGPQGIFKPRVIPEVPLSITTSPDSPYDDSFNKDGFLLYKYRGTNPKFYINVSLRKAFFKKTPLIYFHGVVPGKYLAVWPVFIVGDNPDELTFRVAVDDMTYVDKMKTAGHDKGFVVDSGADARRAYITYGVKHRLHQRGFRERVLSAYKDQCALCRLRHRELLDAAHIIPDNEPGGDPIVKNGISLCKLHHAAFDNLFIGIRPDYKVIVRTDVLEETDGPMLRHGLQGMHNIKIITPRSKSLRPDPDLLERRWERFQRVN